MQEINPYLESSLSSDTFLLNILTKPCYLTVIQEDSMLIINYACILF